MSESTFNLTLPGGVPAIDMGDGYAMVDPTLDVYDMASLAMFTADRYGKIAAMSLEGLPPETDKFANGQDEVAAIHAVTARDRVLIEHCLFHQEDGKWSRVFKPGLTRSQQPKLPVAISEALNQTVWKVLAASEDPFVS